MSASPAAPSSPAPRPAPAAAPHTAAASTGAADWLYVKIYSPYRVYYEGRARSLSAESETGPFDILPKHHNFITLLLACDVIIRTDGGTQTLRIQGGMLHVKANEITLFLDV